MAGERLDEAASTKPSLLAWVKCVVRWTGYILDNLFGNLPRCAWAAYKLGGKLKEALESDVAATDPRLAIDEGILDAYYQAAFERLERIEDKARTNVLALTIATTVMITGIRFFDSNPRLPACLYNWGMLFVGFALFFFVSGGLLALGAYRLVPLFVRSMDDRPEVAGHGTWRRTTLGCIDRNRIRGWQRGNLLAASTTCLRNGVLLLFIFAAIVLFGLWNGSGATTGT